MRILPVLKLEASFVWLLSFSAFVVAALEFPVHNITRFNGLKAENLAVRANGQILVTINSPIAQLYQIDPDSIRAPTLVTNLPDARGAYGIVELQEDVFYVATGNVSLATSTSTPGSFFVFEIDMRTFSALPNGTVVQPAKLRQIAKISGGKFLNGVTAVETSDDFVLVADTYAALVWKVDVTNGQVTVAIQDPTMKGPTDIPGALNIGIDGIKVQDDFLYYTNAGLQTLYRIPISSNGSATGTAQVVTSNITCDDFVLDNKGYAYVAGPMDVVTLVAPGGQQTIIAGTLKSNTSSIVGGTAVQFGRTASDRTSIYVTTNGGTTATINGTQGVSRIDVGDLAQL